jgi:hypothetical protein
MQYDREQFFVADGPGKDAIDLTKVSRGNDGTLFVRRSRDRIRASNLRGQEGWDWWLHICLERHAATCAKGKAEAKVDLAKTSEGMVRAERKCLVHASSVCQHIESQSPCAYQTDLSASSSSTDAFLLRCLSVLESKSSKASRVPRSTSAGGLLDGHLSHRLSGDSAFSGLHPIQQVCQALE